MAQKQVPFFYFLVAFMKIENNYFVKVLYEASFLYAIGLPLIGLKRDGSSYYFIFTPKNECERLRDQFWAMSPELQINPKVYANAVKSLKERIFSNP